MLKRRTWRRDALFEISRQLLELSWYAADPDCVLGGDHIPRQIVTAKAYRDVALAARRLARQVRDPLRDPRKSKC